MYNAINQKRMSNARQKALDVLRAAAHGREPDWIVVMTYRRVCIKGDWYLPNFIVYIGQSEVAAAESLVEGTTFAKHQVAETAKLLALEAAENVRQGRVPSRV